YVIFRGGGEIALAPGGPPPGGRRDSPRPLPQPPTSLLVFFPGGFPRKTLPPPLIDHQPEGQEGDLLQRLVQQQADVLGGVWGPVEQPDLDQVLGRDGERDGVAHRLVEAIVGAV